MSISYGQYITEKTGQWITGKRGVTSTMQNITDRQGEKRIPGISHFHDYKWETQPEIFAMYQTFF